MKYLFFLFLLPVFLNAQENISSTNQNWHTNYEEALDIAKKSNRNILIYFTGSDWCAPCRVLKKEVLDTKEFTSIAKEYVLLYIDVPRKKDRISPDEMEHNMALLSRFNKKGIFPSMIILSSHEREKAVISGYSNQSDKIRYMEFLDQNP